MSADFHFSRLATHYANEFAAGRMTEEQSEKAMDKLELMSPEKLKTEYGRLIAKKRAR